MHNAPCCDYSRQKPQHEYAEPIITCGNVAAIYRNSQQRFLFSDLLLQYQIPSQLMPMGRLTFHSSLEKHLATPTRDDPVVAPWRLVGAHQADLMDRSAGLGLALYQGTSRISCSGRGAAKQPEKKTKMTKETVLVFSVWPVALDAFTQFIFFIEHCCKGAIILGNMG